VGRLHFKSSRAEVEAKQSLGHFDSKCLNRGLVCEAVSQGFSGRGFGRRTNWDAFCQGYRVLERVGTCRNGARGRGKGFLPGDWLR
jgi:hypothetical protein